MTKFNDMLKEIYSYEVKMKIPEKERIVNYIPELKMYSPKAGNDTIKQRYFEIKDKAAYMEEQSGGEDITEPQEASETEDIEADKKENGQKYLPETAEPEPECINLTKELSLKDSRIFVEKIFESGSDRAVYSHKNMKYAIAGYCQLRTKKAIGYRYNDKDHYLMHRDEGEKYSEKDEPVSGAVAYFQNYYEGICGRIEEMEAEEERKRIEEERRQTEEEAARQRIEEQRINPKFQRCFKSLLKKSRKCICGQDFTAFDFRCIDLNGIVFLYCCFDNANFTDLEIKDAVFINCSFDGTIEEGTKYSDCERIGDAPVKKETTESDAKNTLYINHSAAGCRV